MKKNLFTLALLLVASMTTFVQSAFAQLNRDVYGFFVRNEIYGAEYGFAKFNTTDMKNAEFTLRYDELSGIEGMKGIFTGACAEDTYYAYEYDYTPYGPTPTQFVSYNLVTNKRTLLNDYILNKDGSMMTIQDMTYDYKNKIMYALCFDRGVSLLTKVNLKNGERELVCELSESGIGVIAVNMQGEVYGIGQDGFLYYIDTTTGDMEPLIDTGRTGMIQPQTMEFDNTSGLLYWASCTMSEDNGNDAHFIQIDMANDEVTDLGLIGQGSCFVAMYIPFAEGGENAPSVPTDFKVVPAEQGKLAAEVSWTAPTTTFGKGELSSISSIVVERNGVEVARYNNVTPGEKMSFTDDKVETDGMCKYSIYASNEAGLGQKGSQYAYVGTDTPSAPYGVVITPGENCQSAELFWQMSKTGLNEGYLNPEDITFKVVRYPDSVVVAKDLKDTKFVDKGLTTLCQYCYKVFACNRMGETGTYTNAAYVLGQPKELPYTETFEDLYQTFNNYTFVDGNKDYCTWVFNSPAGFYQFGTSEFCMDYIINPGFEHSHMDADEWLITPPFMFDKNKAYKITFEARSIRNEDMEFTMGNRNMKEYQKKIEDFVIVGNDESNFQEFHSYELFVPEGSEGINCLGIRLVTAYPSNDYAHLQLKNITVTECEPNAIDAAVAEDGSVRIENNIVYTNDAAGMVEVFNASGSKVLAMSGSEVSLNSLPAGMYIVKTNTVNGISVKKYMVK